MGDAIKIIDNISTPEEMRIIFDYFFSRDYAPCDRNGLKQQKEKISDPIGILQGSQPIVTLEIYLFGKRVFCKKRPRPLIGFICYTRKTTSESARFHIYVYGKSNMELFKKFSDAFALLSTIPITLELSSSSPRHEVFKRPDSFPEM